MNMHINPSHAFKRALSLSGIPVLTLILGLATAQPARAQTIPKGPSACTSSLNDVNALPLPANAFIEASEDYCDVVAPYWVWVQQEEPVGTGVNYPALDQAFAAENLCKKAGGYARAEFLSIQDIIRCEFPAGE